jgi:TonB family protein
MMEARLLENLAAYSAQVAMVIAAGAVISSISRVRAPRVRHAWWRGLLAAALMLPLFYGAIPTPAAAPVTSGLARPAMVVLNVSMATGRVSSNAPIDWTPIVLGVLAAGVAFRLLWTAMGLWRLRRLREAGTSVPDHFTELQGALGTSAEIRRARSAEQPVTFGLWRPVVMLPDSLFDQPASIQQAVVCHELLHVRRRDWASLLGEEAVRALFWFHPAVWWALSRIQLTREEVVDAEVVETTRERRAYVEALMTFADEAPLTPAAAFARRRHLFRRILLISKEVSMSPARIAVSCLVMAAVAGTGSWYAAWAFPLQVSAPVTAPRPGVVSVAQLSDEIGPLERQAKPVTAENPVPRRTYAVSPQYPTAAGEARGLARIRVTLDAQGRVAEVRDLGARSRMTFASQNGRITQLHESPVPSTDVDRLFFAAAAEAVRQWQFEPPFDAPISFDVSVAFAPGMPGGPRIDVGQADGPAEQMERARREYLLGLVDAQRTAMVIPPDRLPMIEAARNELLEMERAVAERARAQASPGGSATSAIITPRPIDAFELRSRYDLATEEYKRLLAAHERALASQTAGPSERELRAARERALAVEQQTQEQLARARSTAEARVRLFEAEKVAASGASNAPVAPVRVGGAVRPPTRTRDVRPVYPEEAKAAGVQGVVIAEVMIDAQGRVEEARVLRSIPLLDQAALDALRQWEFTPTLLNGSPVPVIMTVTVQFSLNDF